MNASAETRLSLRKYIALIGLGLSTLYSQSVTAAAECGSLEMVGEQIAASVFPAPFGRFGVFGEQIAGVAGLYLFENPGDIVKRCFEEAMGEEEPSPVDDPRNYPGGEEEEEEGLLGSLFGDPHLTTLDNRNYDFQGAGDYVLLRHGQSDVEVQARFARLATNPEASYTRGLAVRVGKRVVTLFEGGLADPDPIVIDGQPIAFLDGGTYVAEDVQVQRIRQWYLVRFPNGLSLATVAGSTIMLQVPPGWAGETAGLLGNGDGNPANDVARRDGSLVDPANADDLYGGFVDDWLVGGDRSLFGAAFDVAEFGPIRPTTIVTLQSLPADAVAEATRLCAERGIPAGPVLEGCVFDVALTGDGAWANSELVGVAEIHADRLAAGAMTTTGRGSLSLGETIEFAAAGAKRRLRWALAESNQAPLFLRNTGLEVAGATDVSTCTARWSIRDAAGKLLANGSLCNDEPRLTVETAAFFEVDVPAGIQGGFVLGVVAEGARVTGRLSEPQRFDGVLSTPGQLDSYQLQVEAGSELLLLDPVGDNDCSMQWALVAGDEQLFKGASCLATDPIAAGGAESVTLSISAGAKTGAYSIEVVPVTKPTNANLQFGKLVEASIGTPGARHRFSFDADAGDRLLLAGPPGANKNCRIWWRIVSSNETPGTVFEAPACLDSDVVEIPASGRYLLEVDGKAAAVGDVSLTAYSVPEPRVDALRFDDRLEFNLGTPGERVQLGFEGKAGEQLVLTNPERSNKDCNIVWRIIGPNGEDDKTVRLFEGPVCYDSSLVSLQNSGRHVLEIAGKKSRTGRVSVIAVRK